MRTGEAASVDSLLIGMNSILSLPEQFRDQYKAAKTLNQKQRMSEQESIQQIAAFRAENHTRKM